MQFKAFIPFRLDLFFELHAMRYKEDLLVSEINSTTRSPYNIRMSPSRSSYLKVEVGQWIDRSLLSAPSLVRRTDLLDSATGIFSNRLLIER